jgi:hypothetical protein
VRERERERERERGNVRVIRGVLIFPKTFHTFLAYENFFNLAFIINSKIIINT